MIRVTIVSPNPALRIGLRELLGRQSGIHVAAETADFDGVNEKETDAAVAAPVSSARLSGIRFPFAILWLTDDVRSVRPLLNSTAPAWGVLSTEATGDELAAAVRALGEGLWVGAPVLVGDLIRLSGLREFSSGDAPVEQLTVREMEVIQLMAQGLANKQIALALGISEHTVKFHLSSLYAKLGISSRTEAVKRGIELGLISL